MTGFSQGLGSPWPARVHQTSQSAGLAAELRTVTVVGGTVASLQMRPVVIAVSRTGPSGMDERPSLNWPAHHFGGPARCDGFTGLSYVPLSPSTWSRS